jgi:N-acetylglucosaminyl-diphospho-decaprenol L-rhamnosyltransferase
LRAAAIVVTHNSREQAAGCLRPLLESGLEVWVVDNASSDGTPALIAEHFSSVRLLSGEENVGFARAVNLALARTSAEVVLLVNPDCVVPPGTVTALLSHLADHPQVGVVAPRILDGDGTRTVSAHPFESLGTVLVSRFGGRLVPRRLRPLLGSRRRRQSSCACLGGERPVAVDWVSGACLAVRGSLLRRLGGLDSGYFLYYEDEELCLQAWRSGARVVILPGAEAVHLGGASSTDPAHVWPHLYRSLLRFQSRHRPGTYPLVRAAILVRAAAGIVFGLGRDAHALARRRPARRALAWLRVARIAALDAPAVYRRARS